MAVRRSIQATSAVAAAAKRAAPLMQLYQDWQPVAWHGHGCSCCARKATTSAGDAAADYAFEVAASTTRFGPGVTREVGQDVANLKAKRVLVVTDKNIAAIPDGPMERVAASLKRSSVNFRVYDDVRIEPTDISFKDAIATATAYNPDVIIAVGGGSAMDTAKAANLYSCFPDADFLDFVNAPVGKGLPVPGPVKPLIAIPTTAGTGSETTGVAIFDYTALHAKTGIGSRMIKPYLGLVDPENTASCPPEVATASGFDVLCHALESYTAIPFNERGPRPTNPALRPAYQGANPVSDVWSTYALRLLAKHFIASVKDRSDPEANAAMALAASYAGVGFGNAGCHLCHGLSYAISGNIKEKGYQHPGYDPKIPLVPHGISVVMSAPAVFRFTAPTNPARHLEAARILAGENPPIRIHMYNAGKEKILAGDEARAKDAGMMLADQLLRYMDVLRVPNGLEALGYVKSDIPALVEGTLPQKRVLNLAPQHSGKEEIAELFNHSMRVY